MPTSPFAKASVIASLNLKGGVGKTHICWLLVSVCQERNKRCLIVDLDQQANITQSFLPEHSEPTGIERIFDPTADVKPGSLVCETRYSHIDVIAATGHLAGYDLSQPEEWQANRLHTALADTLVELAPDYEYILLDCPPRISLSSFSALCAAQYVLIPLEAADWGARGTATVRAAVERVQQHDNPDLTLLGYVVSKFKQRRSFQNAYLSQIRETFDREAFKTIIPDLSQFERAVDNAVPTTLHSPSSHASRIARQLFDEVVARIATCRAREKQPAVGRARRQERARKNAPALAGRP